MEAMDLMDPKRRMAHQVRLITGYVLVGIALLLLTIILLFVAYGFGLQNGRVTQSGLLFLSSAPNPAQIYVDGARYQSDTNTKLLLNEGTYQITLKRDGYHDWQRIIAVAGGKVESYTYPFLFPLDLTTTTLHTYAAAPSLVSESLDQHWLLIGSAKVSGLFDLYDLTNPSQAPVALTLPNGLLTAAHGSQEFTVVAWADDNAHVLIKHTYGVNAEYILLNRSAPAQSQNLTRALHLPLTKLQLDLDNGQQDHYLVFDTASEVLSRSSLGTPTLAPVLDHVLAYAADGSQNTIVYVTPDQTNVHKVAVMAYDGSSKYVIRRDMAGHNYLLAVSDFDGDTYVAVSAPAENAAYVYKDPIKQINDPRFGVAVPVQAFMIKGPTYAAFSPTGQYAVFESGKQFATYDADNQQAFDYTVNDSLDASMTHAQWMDGARLSIVSHGQIVVFDYDSQNRQTLVQGDPRFPPAFDDSYKFLYTLTPSAEKTSELLTSTSLRTPADQ